VESAAIATLIALVMDTGRGVHVAHLSTAEGLAFISDAQRRGLPITAEACPQYLLFTAADLAHAGPFGKVNPPIRSKRHQDALWSGLKEGVISIIASDHSPFSVAEKEETWHDLRVSPPGIASIDVFYPLVLNMALQGKFSLAEAIQLVSTRPAKMYRLFPNKGIIQVGADADVVLFDPEGTTTIDRQNWHSKAALCDHLFTGMTLKGRLRQTIVGGNVIFRDGEILGKRGGGRFIRPLPDAAPQTAFAGDGHAATD
jgi:dihydroorotase-like cyclic amidohydrolase